VGYPGQQRIMKGTTSGQDSKKMSKNIFKDALSVNRTKSNIRRNQKNYIYLIYHRDHGKKSVSILLDHCPSQME